MPRSQRQSRYSGRNADTLDPVEVGGMGCVLLAAKDFGRIRVMCRATRRRIHQRTEA
jgi:hypothetical protein